MFQGCLRIGFDLQTLEPILDRQLKSAFDSL